MACASSQLPALRDEGVWPYEQDVYKLLTNGETATHRSSGLLLAVVGVLPVLAAFGPLLPVLNIAPQDGVQGVANVGGALYAFRICVLVFAALCVLAPRVATRSPVRSKFVLLVAVWAVTGVMLMFQVTDIRTGSNELFSVGIGVLLTLALSTLADPEQVLQWLTRGWLAAFLITSLVAGWETLSGRHLPNYALGRTTELFMDYNFPASVFGNPNNYAFFLVAAFPMLIIGLMSSTRRSVRVLYALSAGALPIVVFATGSRMCMAAIAIQGVVVLSFVGKRFVLRVAGFLLLAGCMVIFFLPAAFSDTVQKAFSMGFAGGPGEWLNELSGGGRSSGAVRLNLTKDGLWMTENSYMQGVGPGNFQTIMTSGAAPYPAAHVINPHNGFVEILAQYGALVTVLFLVWMGSCFALGWHAVRCTSLPRKDSLRITGLCLVLAIGALPLTSMASSSFFNPSYSWMLLASLLVMAMAVERGSTRVGIRPAAGIPHPSAVEHRRGSRLPSGVGSVTGL